MFTHTVPPRTSSLGGETPSSLVAHLPPSQSRRMQPASSKLDLLHGAHLCEQPAARPAQRQPSPAARTGQRKTASRFLGRFPQFERCCAYRHTPPHLPERAHASDAFDSNSTPSATSEPLATQLVQEGRSVGSGGEAEGGVSSAWVCTTTSD